MYCVVKEEWQITPATSDLFQASLTVLEMHARAARWIGVGSIAPHEAVQENVARIPVDKVRKMNPAKAESWLVEQLGYNKLKDKIESSGIDGRQLLKIAKMSQKEAAAALGIKMATAKAHSSRFSGAWRRPRIPCTRKLRACLQRASRRLSSSGRRRRQRRQSNSARGLRNARSTCPTRSAATPSRHWRPSHHRNTPTRPSRQPSVGCRRLSCYTAIRQGPFWHVPSGWESLRILGDKRQSMPIATSGSGTARITYASSTCRAARAVIGAMTC